MPTDSYIVASNKDWHLNSFSDLKSSVPGDWHYVDTPEKLKTQLNLINPRYIFFLHWSWLVPESIWKNIECVCFHMTDVPYGRGGSPLQNLILKGHKETKLTALQMVKELDAGPVYAKAPLSLQGSAEEIYKRAGQLSLGLIQWIIRDNPEPAPQKGSPVLFERRRPEQSRINPDQSNKELYDFIRMLDAPGYPKAFLESEGLRLEFSNARWENDRLVADVCFNNLSEDS
tara:strand:- start:340 stop:1029 length:690 start_codon:yes stop_codon:yes gene_type:complete